MAKDATVKRKVKSVTRRTILSEEYIAMGERFGPFKPRILRFVDAPHLEIVSLAGARAQMLRALPSGALHVKLLDGKFAGHLFVMPRDDLEDV